MVIFSAKYTSSALKEWSLRAFTDVIQPIGSRYLLSNRNLVVNYSQFGNLFRFLKFYQVRKNFFENYVPQKFLRVSWILWYILIWRNTFKFLRI